MPKTHNIRVHERFWSALHSEKKKAEFRLNDRDYQTGDMLSMIPVNDAGAELNDVVGQVPQVFHVTHIVHGPDFGIPEGYCMMSIEPE